MFTFPLLLTIYAGFTHAFEADHLLAVSNIVSRRNSIKMSIKDGIYWGLGHASTIFIIGLLMIVFKASISERSFQYFEAVIVRPTKLVERQPYFVTYHWKCCL